NSVQVNIIPITDAAVSNITPLPSNTIGEIVVKGDVVTQSYCNRPEATRLAKIAGAGSQLAHRMGDLGYLDDTGHLWFCGRKSHRVTTANETLYTVPCEMVFNQHPKVFRSALVGVNKDGETKPVLCVQLEPGV